MIGHLETIWEVVQLSNLGWENSSHIGHLSLDVSAEFTRMAPNVSKTKSRSSLKKTAAREETGGKSS